MKVKELLDLFNNVYYVVICEPGVKHKQYHIDDVPEEYNDYKVTQIDVCYNCEGTVDDDDLILRLEVEE